MSVSGEVVTPKVTLPPDLARRRTRWSVTSSTPAPSSGRRQTGAVARPAAGPVPAPQLFLVHYDHGDAAVVTDGQGQAAGSDGTYGEPAANAAKACSAGNAPEPYGPVAASGGQEQAATASSGERERGDPPVVAGERPANWPPGERIPQADGRVVPPGGQQRPPAPSRRDRQRVHRAWCADMRASGRSGE